MPDRRSRRRVTAARSRSVVSATSFCAAQNLSSARAWRNAWFGTRGFHASGSKLALSAGSRPIDGDS